MMSTSSYLGLDDQRRHDRHFLDQAIEDRSLTLAFRVNGEASDMLLEQDLEVFALFLALDLEDCLI